MSYSQMQTMAGPPSHFEQQLQLQLQTLLEGLRSWAYVALWSVNPQTRNLVWRGGHWRRNDTDLWDENYFTSTYKSCITTLYGSVDVAFAEGVNLWMNGSNVPDSAGSKEKAEFLQRTGISTAVFIPWPNGVLELGTCENLPENPPLIEEIRHYLLKSIMPTLGPHPNGYSQLVSRAPSSSFTQAASLRAQRSSSLMQAPPYASMSPLRHLGADALGAQSFEPNSLNQQIIRRSGSMTSTLNPDMFLQQPGDATTEVGSKDTDSVLDPDMLLPADARNWRLPILLGSNSRAAATSMALQALQTPIQSAAHQVYYPPMQQRTRGKYRTRSGNTSASSVSSYEEAACSTRLPSVDSPEQNTSNNNMFFMANSQHQTSHSNTSSSPARGTPSHSPEIMNQLEDHSTHGNTGTTPSLQESNRVEDEIHAIMMLANEGGPLDSHEPWRNLYSASLQEPTAGNMSQINLLDSRLDSSAANSNGNRHSHRIHNNRNNVTGNSDSYMNGTHNSVVRNGLSQSIPGLHTHGPFKSWRHGRILAPAMRRSSDRQNQELLRRCMDMMKQIPHLQSGMQNEAAGQQSPPPQQQQQQQQQQTAVVQNVGQQGPRVASSSSPETVPTDNGFGHDPFDPVPSLRGRRPRGGSRISAMGSVHSGHEEAAMNHMMAERRRREKQKENFAALRKLVPIISKADKASILGDAIVYLMDLQNTIKSLEATCVQSEKKYESLKLSYKELEQRNKELESIVCPPRLNHSM